MNQEAAFRSCLEYFKDLCSLSPVFRALTRRSPRAPWLCFRGLRGRLCFSLWPQAFGGTALSGPRPSSLSPAPSGLGHRSPLGRAVGTGGAEAALDPWGCLEAGGAGRPVQDGRLVPCMNGFGCQAWTLAHGCQGLYPGPCPSSVIQASRDGVESIFLLVPVPVPPAVLGCCS